MPSRLDGHQGRTRRKGIWRSGFQNERMWQPCASRADAYVTGTFSEGDGQYLSEARPKAAANRKEAAAVGLAVSGQAERGRPCIVSQDVIVSQNAGSAPDWLRGRDLGARKGNKCVGPVTLGRFRTAGLKGVRGTRLGLPDSLTQVETRRAFWQKCQLRWKNPEPHARRLAWRLIHADGRSPVPFSGELWSLRETQRG